MKKTFVLIGLVMLTWMGTECKKTCKMSPDGNKTNAPPENVYLAPTDGKKINIEPSKAYIFIGSKGERVTELSKKILEQHRWSAGEFLVFEGVVPQGPCLPVLCGSIPANVTINELPKSHPTIMVMGKPADHGNVLKPVSCFPNATGSD